MQNRVTINKFAEKYLNVKLTPYQEKLLAEIQDRKYTFLGVDYSHDAKCEQCGGNFDVNSDECCPDFLRTANGKNTQ